MKIAMIGTKGMPTTMGGIERHVEELSARLAARGFDVTAYARPWYTSRAPWSQYVHRGIRVVTLPSIPTKHWGAISHTLMATLHAIRERYDIYHFHGVGPALCAWIPRLFRPRSRVVVTFHCVDRRHAKWGRVARVALALGEWAACTFPHETITVGETLTAYCAERYGITTTCIPNGVVPASVVSGAVASDTLRALGLTSRRYVLVVSRLVPHKGIHTTIAAFRQLQREHNEFRDLQLAIVGAPACTDSYLDELRVLAAGDPAIRFLGARSGAVLDVLYQQCLAFVHASASEGLPIVVLEAAAAGAVPIVSDIPEHREVIDRIGGFFFPVGDPWRAAATLEIVLRTTALPTIGREIRRAVCHVYDWNNIVRRTGDRYTALRHPRECAARVQRRATHPRFAV